MYYDRESKEIKESTEYQKGLLNFLYKTIPGRILLKTIIAQPWFSNLRAKYYKSPKSKNKIKPFIEKYNIQMDSWNKKSFETFNDFFTRKRDVEINKNNNLLISPADSKLSIYKIKPNLKLEIKNSIYDLEDIVLKNELLKEYKNGYCLVFRLSVDDYHRYHYIDDGNLIENYKIKGKLHTVRPISEKYNVFSRNSREISILETKHLDQIIQIEVGALLVGAIRNNKKSSFSRGEEKGYFEYGGSTIILLLKNSRVSIDEDILEQSKKGIETKVHIGERIGIIN